MSLSELAYLIGRYTDYDGYDRSMEYYNGVENGVVQWISDVTDVDPAWIFRSIDMTSFDTIVAMDIEQSEVLGFTHHQDVYVLVPIR